MAIGKIFDKLVAKAEVAKESSYNVQQFYVEGEDTLKIFKFARDELIISTKGIYSIDAQGLTGTKVEYKFFPMKNLKYVSVETAGTYDRDFDLKIGIDGHSGVISGVFYANIPLTVKVHKDQTAHGIELFNLLKNISVY